ncbi:MAG: phosphotransferase [Bacteroidales bacterium]|nr:phosphotransferase [Candidatus Liminaster caballi]
MDAQLSQLYAESFGHNPVSAEALSGSASDRHYCRITDADGTTVIGVTSSNRAEVRAFCELDESMAAQGIRVPRIIAMADDCYLQQDLGTTSLYDMIARCQKSGVWDEETVAVLHQVMRDLVDIQFSALRGFDISHCCREQKFTSVNVRWDLNYFKYCFLKGTGVEIDELRLQAEFDRLETALLSVPCHGTFLYRDFQSRNVMVSEGKPWYIDFQAGYEGPVYYDVASFLWQARAAYPEDLRQSLLATYLNKLRTRVEVTDSEFANSLRHFVFFRLLQVLGAYGFRGIFERKAAFLSPIAQALASISQLAHPDYPYINALIADVAATPRFRNTDPEGELTVRITSFSFKKGIPDDYSGNGGGFVFDCRAPHNPGRYAEYKRQTGLDQPVIDFLEGRDPDPAHRPIGCELTMPQFLEHVYAVVDPAVETYLTRGFTSLMVSFGCTGGQHRSVYGAQHLAEHLKQLHPGLRIILTHREQNIQQIL